MLIGTGGPNASSVQLAVLEEQECQYSQQVFERIASMNSVKKSKVGSKISGVRQVEQEVAHQRDERRTTGYFF